jgi:hypothetical protein
VARAIDIIRTDASSALRLRTGRSLPHVAPEVGRIFELACPHSDFGNSRPVLVGNIVQRVFSERDRLAVFDHPPADVYAIHIANRDYATVSISVAARAARRFYQRDCGPVG